jgi:hypothetical protein
LWWWGIREKSNWQIAIGSWLLAFGSSLLALCQIGDTFSDFDFQFRRSLAIPVILAICF